jgi:hypothetical protein
MSYEFIIVLAVGAAATQPSFPKFKNSFLGLFAVATILYIQAAYAFYNASALTYYNIGSGLQTIRTIVAGKQCTPHIAFNDIHINLYVLPVNDLSKHTKCFHVSSKETVTLIRCQFESWA